MRDAKKEHVGDGTADEDTTATAVAVSYKCVTRSGIPLLAEFSPANALRFVPSSGLLAHARGVWQRTPTQPDMRAPLGQLWFSLFQLIFRNALRRVGQFPPSARETGEREREVCGTHRSDYINIYLCVYRTTVCPIYMHTSTGTTAHMCVIYST